MAGPAGTMSAATAKTAGTARRATRMSHPLDDSAHHETACISLCRSGPPARRFTPRFEQVRRDGHETGASGQREGHDRAHRHCRRVAHSRFAISPLHEVVATLLPWGLQPAPDADPWVARARRVLHRARGHRSGRRPDRSPSLRLSRPVARTPHCAPGPPTHRACPCRPGQAVRTAELLRRDADDLTEAAGCPEETEGAADLRHRVGGLVSAARVRSSRPISLSPGQHHLVCFRLTGRGGGPHLSTGHCTFPLSPWGARRPGALPGRGSGAATSTPATRPCRGIEAHRQTVRHSGRLARRPWRPPALEAA